MAAKYVQIADQLRSYLTQNTNISIKLPTEHELCTRYSVSRQTVRKALSVLADEGVITKKQGSGSYSAGNTALAKDKQNTIALILNSDSEYLYPALINDIRSRLQQQSYTLLVYTTGGSFAFERQILKTIDLHTIKGIIAEPCKTTLATPNDDLYFSLQSHGISIVFLYGNYINLQAFPCVALEDYLGGYQVGQYLLENNHYKSACIFNSESIMGINRYHGFCAALRDQNVQFYDDGTEWFNYKQLYELQTKQDLSFLSDFIDNKLKSCTAVVCQNDEIAYWLVKLLKKSGLSIPSDISVICFNNSYLNDISEPSVTTMSYKPRELGYCVADNIISLIRKRTTVHNKLQFHLLDKKTVQKNI